jgi:hypothetical protein
MNKIMNESDDNYDGLVSKLFVIIEMDGFGYPMLDILNTFLCSKGKEMYDKTQTLMSEENVQKEVSEKVDNIEGKSEIELEESFEKKEMELENNYSDVLFIYWVTMFYISIYPVGIVQSFINLLFKFIIEKNFLMNVYKRPEFIDPKAGFFCFNFFNFGYFLFLWGNYIFFKNDYNEKSFGLVYILIMILTLVIPIFLLAKLLFNCCKKLNKEEENKYDDVKNQFKSEYKLLNPCSQKKEIEKIFENFKKNGLLTETQYKLIEDKINNMNIRDFYNLEKKLRVPKKNITFEERKVESLYIYENESIEVDKEEKDKIQLYNYLIQLGFLDYLEEGNICKPKKNKIVEEPEKNIESESLIKLSLQENISNSDSDCFNTFFDENEDKLILVYVKNGNNVLILDVFEKKLLYSLDNLHSTSSSFSLERFKIVCANYFKIDTTEYLVTIAQDNSMLITNLNEINNNKNKGYHVVSNNFQQKNKDNFFSLSTVKHGESVSILTSYNYDKSFSIFDIFGNCQEVECDDYVISLEALYYTKENFFVCVRTANSILLYINNFFIKKIYQTSKQIQVIYNNNNQEKNFINNIQNENDNFINFKLKRINEKIYVFISNISSTLNYYNIEVYDISNIFPYYTKIFQSNNENNNNNNENNENNNNNNNNFNSRVNNKFKNFLSKIIFGQEINKEVHIVMNEQLCEKIKNNNPNDLLPECSFKVDLKNNEINLDEIEIHNIGNILYWDNKYIIVGTPFGYLDILDYKKKEKVGKINNAILTEQNKNLQIIAYNISEVIDHPLYDKSFIMRDNKGKIQYIRRAIIEDKLNYKIIKSEEYFNELPEEEKLQHIRFSMNFYFLYCFISYFIPLCVSTYSNYDPEKELTNEYYNYAIYCYVFYTIFGIWFKGCVYDIDDESHTKRTLTKLFLYLSLISKIAGNSFLAYRYCEGNENGFILVFMIFLLFLTHAITNCCIYMNKIKFILKKYWLNFLFYQISRFLILFYFMICVIDNINKLDVYIYALILCIIMIYTHFVNYFNTLFKEIIYTSKCQAIFNYPFEWMNLLCCYCKVPKECIKELDRKYCTCDSCVLMVIQMIIYCAIVLFIFICLFMLFAFLIIFQSLGRRNDD